MRISHKHKFVLISIPKTAGTTIRYVLDYYSDIKSSSSLRNRLYYHHISAGDLKVHFNKQNWDWNKYYKFCFARNPWDRMVSAFYFKKKMINILNTTHISDTTRLMERKWFQDTLLGAREFSEWILKQNNSEYPASYIVPFQKPLVFENGNTLVDYIGRFENLQEDFNIICDKIGIPRQELPHKNATKHKHYTEYYDDETREIVAERYANDIEYFGYEFGE
jgi:hypothetical protein